MSANSETDINQRLRDLLKGQQGVRHELTKCRSPDLNKRRCPLCGSEKRYKANEFREISCDGIRMRVTYPAMGDVSSQGVKQQ